MRAADARPANMRSADMRRPEPTAAACPEAYSAAVSAKPAEMAAAAVAAKSVAATVSTATVSAAVSTATAAAGVCFECDKRHDEEQHRGHASAGRQHRPHGAAGLGAPHRCGRLSLGIPPRTKSL
jgi:hypothetical protein